MRNLINNSLKDYQLKVNIYRDIVNVTEYLFDQYKQLFSKVEKLNGK